MPEGEPGAARAEDRAPLAGIGVVAIGRNEGQRLVRCLDSLPRGLGRVVYVDSASTDGSVEEARRRGVEVLPLDLSLPFTAARARNAGLARLREADPWLEYVQFIDGDCVMAGGWLEAARDELERTPRLAVACGRRREQRPEASVYNLLCDLEWDTPIGDTESCGGDALVRMSALAEVGGFDGALIAGEEPELCFRLRARGWGVRRLDRDMTWHDAALTRFAQWWRRATRTGHAFAEVAALHPGMWRRQARSAAGWGLVIPSVSALAAWLAPGFGLAVLAAYPALWLRIYLGRAARDGRRTAALYASSCVVGKFAELAGMARYWLNHARGLRSPLIEYK